MLGVVGRVGGGEGRREKGGRREYIGREEVEEVGTRVEGCGKGREGAGCVSFASSEC